MIELTESESVRRNGESFSIGDKVYSKGRAHFGVGYIKRIELYGVHFGFKAQVDSLLTDSPKWFDSRNLTKETPSWLNVEQLNVRR